MELTSYISSAIIFAIKCSAITYSDKINIIINSLSISTIALKNSIYLRPSQI